MKTQSIQHGAANAEEHLVGWAWSVWSACSPVLSYSSRRWTEAVESLGPRSRTWSQLLLKGTGSGGGALCRGEPLLVRALREAEQTGSDADRIATAANNLGLLYHDQGRLAEAQVLYGRALTNWEARFGPEHEQVAAALNNLAEIADAEGDWAEAEPLYERVLAIERKVLGAAHPDVAISRQQLGRTLSEARPGDGSRVVVWLSLDLAGGSLRQRPSGIGTGAQ